MTDRPSRRSFLSQKIMLELKEIKNIVGQIAEMRQLPKDLLWNAIESALGAAYKREYAKTDQIIRSRINRETGETQFFQVKQVLDKNDILPEDESSQDENDARIRFNSERHMLLEDAKLVNTNIKPGEELFFELEAKTDFGRIAAQSARQAITQNLHNAERTVAIEEFKEKEHTLTNGQVQRIERGNVFVDLGRTVAILPFSEQIRGERFRQGERIRTYIVSIDAKKRKGGFVLLSRANPNFVVKLFELEVPELEEGLLVIRRIVRDAGIRTKLAVESKDSTIDPIGSLVGQRGVRIMTVKSELGGEQIDVIPWTEDENEFVGEALSPAEALEVSIDGDTAHVKVSDDQIPIAIGRGGQNLKLASALAEKKIILVNSEDEEVALFPDENGELLILQAREERDERGAEEGPEEENENMTSDSADDGEPADEDEAKEANKTSDEETAGQETDQQEQEGEVESGGDEAPTEKTKEG